MKNIAVFGMGLIGKKRVNSLKKLGVNPTLLIDPCLDEGGIQYKDIDSVPKSKLEKLEYAIICVPHHLTLPIFKKVSKYTKKVLLEKPMGINLDEANKFLNYSIKNSCEIFVGFNYRYLEHIKKLKRLIDSGFFGELFEIDMRIGHGGRKNMEQEWKLKKEFAGGGAAIDPGIHLIDLALYLTNKELKISYKHLDKIFWNSDVEDRFSTVFNSEKTLVKISTDLVSWVNTFEVVVKGSDGFAKLNGRGGNYGEMRISYCKRWFWENGEGEIESKNYCDENSFLEETREFIFEENSSISATSEDGLKAMELIEKIYSE